MWLAADWLSLSLLCFAKLVSYARYHEQLLSLLWWTGAKVGFQPVFRLNTRWCDYRTAHNQTISHLDTLDSGMHLLNWWIIFEIFFLCLWILSKISMVEVYSFFWDDLSLLLGACLMLYPLQTFGLSHTHWLVADTDLARHAEWLFPGEVLICIVGKGVAGWTGHTIRKHWSFSLHQSVLTHTSQATG